MLSLRCLARSPACLPLQASSITRSRLPRVHAPTQAQVRLRPLLLTCCWVPLLPPVCSGCPCSSTATLLKLQLCACVCLAAPPAGAGAREDLRSGRQPQPSPAAQFASQQQQQQQQKQQHARRPAAAPAAPVVAEVARDDALQAALRLEEE